MRKFDYVAGVGGIGKGVLFRFLENTTLGRNESRLAELSAARDFCKLHIILHYTALFSEGKWPVYPIACIGSDTNGDEILGDMQNVGLSTKYVQRVSDADTLYSVCFIYPNSDGGNITTIKSAAEQIKMQQIDDFFAGPDAKGNGLLLAAPEVPVPIRKYFLAEGRKRGCYTAASFAPEEACAFLQDKTLKDIDLLSLNIAEAIAVTGLNTGDIAAECYRKVSSIHRDITLVITNGASGCDLFSLGKRVSYPAHKMNVISTAGAGDSLLGTLLAAILHGIPLIDVSKNCSDALSLAMACSAMKVTALDSIHFGLNRKALLRFIQDREISLSEETLKNFWPH